MIGKKSSSASPQTSLFSNDSRAAIHARLPRRVLISPLWAIRRKGWARLHVGKVFVEKREWTIARREVVVSVYKSG
jgi:hypothetical protein